MFEEFERNYDAPPPASLEGNAEAPFPILDEERMTLALKVLHKKSERAVELLDVFYRNMGTVTALEFIDSYMDVLKTFDAMTYNDAVDPPKNIHPANVERILTDKRFLHSFAFLTEGFKVVLEGLEKHAKEGDIDARIGARKILDAVDEFRRESAHADILLAPYIDKLNEQR